MRAIGGIGRQARLNIKAKALTAHSLLVLLLADRAWRSPRVSVELGYDLYVSVVAPII